MVEEDAEAMQQELKEAFRLYDKEGNVTSHRICRISVLNIFFTNRKRVHHNKYTERNPEGT